MERILIVNADDFGLTRGVNAAVRECAANGVLRSATIMANGSAFEHAVQTAGNIEDFGVGIHFVLTRFQPVCDAARIPELVEDSGSLPSGPLELLKALYSGRGAREAVRKELLAQTEKVFDSGIVPTHFDSHKHVHIIPAVFDAMAEIANRYSVKWVRDPYENTGSFKFLFDVERGTKGKFLKQLAAGIAVRPARSYFAYRVRQACLNHPRFFHGVASTGLLTRQFMTRLSETLKPGINELMTHPGYLDPDLELQQTRLLASRDIERKIIGSAEIKMLLQRKGIVLSHFGKVNP